jgi:hypothetical protein
MDKLITNVSRAESYKDFTRVWLYNRNHSSISFELPISFQLNPGDRIVFYKCTVKMGTWDFIDNKSYSCLEAYRKGTRKPILRLTGKQAEALERLAEKN